MGAGKLASPIRKALVKESQIARKNEKLVSALNEYKNGDMDLVRELGKEKLAKEADL